jgi:hypothetical protein
MVLKAENIRVNLPISSVGLYETSYESVAVFPAASRARGIPVCAEIALRQARALL